jgi:ERCC4-type nuclease
MKIKIDFREKILINIINALIKENHLDIEVVLENLHLGDIIFFDEANGLEKIIIERKTLNDLACSIKDGRYAEQSLRLSHSKVSNHNIIYLIEGTMDNYSKKYTNITSSTLYSSMFSIQYFKGFSIFRSFDIQETAEIILRFFLKFKKEIGKEGYYCIKESELNNENNKTQNNNYCEVIKKIKKDNITPENIGSIILSQIPGISTRISQVIMKNYCSLYDLIISLKDNPNCMNNLTYKTDKGQERRISHKAISSIKDYLLYNKNNTININT